MTEEEAAKKAFEECETIYDALSDDALARAAFLQLILRVQRQSPIGDGTREGVRRWYKREQL